MPSAFSWQLMQKASVLVSSMDQLKAPQNRMPPTKPTVPVSLASAAMILPGAKLANEDVAEVRIAFDGDAVLFDPASQHVFDEQGLDAFHEHEDVHEHDHLHDHLHDHEHVGGVLISILCEKTGYEPDEIE